MTEALPDIEELRAWVGRTETRSDHLDPWTARAMAATLGRPGVPEAGDPLPPGWHWAFFREAAPATALGRDGHPRRGGFLPPVPLPRRMWAGGRLSFPGTLRVGARAVRVSEILSVEGRQGRTGPLIFVTVRHTIDGGEGPAVAEEHDIVYRADPRPGDPAPAAQPAPGGASWTRRVVPDPVLLFRYSALTFNGHRIHYDLSYATGVEGYPGLVVHAPLMATLLLDLLEREAGAPPVRHFAFRGMAPVFDTAAFTLNGRAAGTGAELWVAGPAGELAVNATATFGP
ncbi:FAS1-like dehydratase domain-containing protein [Arenibaculum pallidiluteum]|uniref:FAS1-like dehydratase domain-containing protein n=1 Tax=Arenibaculum pallidiluteum TaxID=2812559 RepID=UPI002E2CA42C|nr:MaoC family dehydratase N-terminal domain-containing protein [Arenibaculum pallidiluteum]